MKMCMMWEKGGWRVESLLYTMCGGLCYRGMCADKDSLHCREESVYCTLSGGLCYGGSVHCTVS